MRKLHSTEMSQEESNQMTGMMNWGLGNQEIHDIGIRVFKQYSEKDKTLRAVYEVTSRDFVNGKWRLYQGKGSSVIEAMGNYSKDRQREK